MAKHKTSSKAHTPVVLNNEATPIKFADVVTKHFLGYAIRVISDRALPSGADGLKPVQRRILWTLYETKTLPTSSFKKCARIIGDTLGKYHPHADGSVYGALVNMTSNYAMYPLVESQGNFGIRGEDPPAAIRYTESRVHKNAMSLALEDLNEKCVDFQSNYDQTLEEPVALPVKVPLLLLNGTLGIAVSVASFIPSHNLGEVIKMCLAALKDDREKAYRNFLGPDWLDDGYIYFSDEERRKVFESGRGSVKLLAKIEKEEPIGRRKTGRLKIWSIPWTTHRQKILEQIIALQDEIPDLRIEKSLKPDEPKITLETAEDLDRVEKLLLKKTLLSTSYSYNMVYLDGRLPIQGGIYDVIQHWLQFRKETLRKHFQLQLAKIQHELKFLDAKIKLTDEVFDAFMRKLRTESRKETLEYLVSRLPTDLETAERILATRLSVFSRDSDADFFQKQKQLMDDSSRLQGLIDDEQLLKEYIENELKALKQHSSPRRLQILDEEPKIAEATVHLETRQFKITPSLSIVPGSGLRYSTGDSFAVITKDGALRLRLKDFRKFRDGAEVDLTALPAFADETRAPLYISTKDELLLIIFKDGNAQVLDTTKVRISNTLRAFKNDSEILQIIPVDANDDRLLVTINTKHQFNVNRFNALYTPTSRVLSKIRFANSEILEAKLVDSEALIKFKVSRAKKAQHLRVSEYVTDKRTVKMIPVSAERKVTEAIIFE